MNNLKHKEEAFFEEHGLAVANGPALVGNTYPIFGMITSVLDLGEGEVEVVINKNIIAKMHITDEDKLDVLRKKAFETGIFVSKVLSIEPKIEVECQTVIFGRDQSYNA
jgi:hypothetical protein